MSVRHALNTAVLTLAMSLAVGAGLPLASVHAQQNAAPAANPGSVRQALEQQLGKRAKVKLVSGQDLEGKVVEVGNEVVIVSELTGMEFFGATVRLDQVAAVIVRTSTP